ncbi:hypothetical protein [Cognatazoarcus halotolerans]|uniref:hypothetical protein n=1 Tax=Cognatazoarcus halotolerans TaxID=2686016 RepID=UPI00135A27DD|nr:hypothetical protein [Cognatazoarcus halotolerans]MCB1898556.1 hypothetical protein [Rhodocyclaceae bacterium]MCP5310207.1 hypothetical protein [Zoogloeaceae bacterium]
MNFFVAFFKTVLLMALIVLTFGGGACFVIGLGEFNNGGALFVPIGGGVALLFGWAAWMLLKSFRKPPAGDDDIGPNQGQD